MSSLIFQSSVRKLPRNAERPSTAHRLDATLFGLALLLSPVGWALQIAGGRTGPADAVLSALVLLFALTRPSALMRQLCSIDGFAGLFLVAWVALAWFASMSDDITDLLSPVCSLVLYVVLVPMVLRSTSIGSTAAAAMGILVIADGLLLVLGASSTIGGSITTGSGRIYTWLTPVGTLSTNGAVGVLLAIGFLLGGLHQRFVWAVGAAGLALVVADGSRAAAIGLVAGTLGVVMLALVSLGEVRRSVRTRVILGGCAIAAVAMLITLNPSVLGDRILQQSVAAFQDPRQNQEARVGGYEEALSGIAEHPLLGPGFHSTIHAGSFQVVHNAWLQVAVDVGIPGALCLIYVCVAPLVLGLRRLGQAEVRQSTPSFACVLAAVGIFICCIVKFMTHPLGLVISDWVPYLVGTSLLQPVVAAERLQSRG
jgi:hypothetical protein